MNFEEFGASSVLAAKNIKENDGILLDHIEKASQADA